MTRYRLTPAALLVAALVGTAVAAQDKPEVAPAPRPAVDLTGYRTAKEAARADPKEFKAALPTSVAASGYLGVVVGDKAGTPVVEAVEPDSPADAAGVQAGDQLVTIDGNAFATAAAARDALRARLAGDKVVLGVRRADRVLDLTATLRAASSPLAPPAGGRPTHGITPGEANPGGGLKVEDVAANSPAATAGLKAGDVILKVDGKDVENRFGFREAIADKRAGDRVDLLVERGEKRLEFRVYLAAEGGGGRFGGGWDSRLPGAWRRPSYTLAILGIEYPDVKHNAKIKDSDWEESMFSTGTYTEKSATGEKVYGSMNDYYRELSYGKFHVEGKFLGWVEAKKKRTEYSSGTGTDSREKLSLLTEALDLYTAKNGKESLKDYEGIFFLYAGGRVQTTRGGLYWPHRANVSYGGKRWPYFIVNEQGPGGRMNDISVFCHEFGHMLGLPDLYARPEMPGSEGVGVWCAMSNQLGGGRPQHFSAWSKEQLGWIQPAVLDPRVKQKLILSPIEDDPTQCYKVMVRADGSEYFLLENRRKKGWDAGLPAEGLLIWRVVGGSRGGQPVYLEEAHGIEGASGPGTSLANVPFPSPQNNAFTPYTTPSSRSQLGGGLPVYITNIRRLPDGRVTFHIGYEYQ